MYGWGIRDGQPLGQESFTLPESSAGGASSAEARPGHENNHALGDDLSFLDILDILHCKAKLPNECLVHDSVYFGASTQNWVGASELD